MPQPIETAPKDGTVILTNEGIVRWQPYWNSPPEWHVCTPWGDVYSCADNGDFTASPTLWEPLPSWIA